MNVSPAPAKVVCSDQKVIALGPAQAAHMVQVGAITYAGREQGTGQPVYYAPAHTLHEINAIVMSEPSLRECDLCTGTPADWRVNCRRFELLVGPNRGGYLGGPERPIFLCSECSRVVAKRDVDRAMAYLIDRMLSLGEERKLIRPGVTKQQLRDAIAPQLRDTVAGMMTNMTGPPEEV